jgi:hypothetical protein
MDYYVIQRAKSGLVTTDGARGVRAADYLPGFCSRS